MRTWWSIVAGVAAAVAVGLLAFAPPPRETAEADQRIQGPTARVLEAVVKDLQAWSRQHGRYPDNDEGLGALVASLPTDSALAALLATATTTLPEEPSARRRALEFGGCPLRPLPGGLEDGGGVPFGYENRAGRPAAAFAGSPVDDALAGPTWLGLAPDAGPHDRSWWFRQVAEGVYVYSWSTWRPWLARREHLVRERRRQSAALSSLLVAFFAFLAWVHACRSGAAPGSKTLQGLATVVWSLFPGLVVALFAGHGTVMCYRPAALPFRKWDRDAAAAQARLLEQFQARGVLKPETVEKLEEAASEQAFAERNPGATRRF